VDNPSDAATAPTGKARVVTVLNINDEDAIRYVLSRMLRSSGYTVVDAASGQEGLRLAADGPDVILLDVQLPDIHGYRVCEMLKADPSTASIPVLMISANFVLPADQAAGLQIGAAAYLTHPISVSDLRDTVEKALSA